LRVYTTPEDRPARFGFDFLSWLCGRFGTETVVVNRSEYVSTPGGVREGFDVDRNLDLD